MEPPFINTEFALRHLSTTGSVFVPFESRTECIMQRISVHLLFLCFHMLTHNTYCAAIGGYGLTLR